MSNRLIPLGFIKLNPTYFFSELPLLQIVLTVAQHMDVFHYSVLASLYTVLFKTCLLIISFRLILNPQISIHTSTGDVIPLSYPL